MLFDGKPEREWKDGEERKNKIVFIGRKLDKEALKKEVAQCIVSE